jgi:3-deoxy-D-manno-octulosonic-acid transferase
VNEVESLLQSGGLRVSRRSTWGQEGPSLNSDLNAENTHPIPTVLLGDSLGEMALYYSLADVALLGGSFEKLGGQNLIEAAACACPIVMGPHTFNFSEASEAAQNSGAAQRAPNMAEAVRLAIETVLNRQVQQKCAHQATQFSQQHGGATERTVLAVQELLNSIRD